MYGWSCCNCSCNVLIVAIGSSCDCCYYYWKDYAMMTLYCCLQLCFTCFRKNGELVDDDFIVEFNSCFIISLYLYLYCYFLYLMLISLISYFSPNPTVSNLLLRWIYFLIFRLLFTTMYYQFSLHTITTYILSITLNIILAVWKLSIIILYAIIHIIIMIIIINISCCCWISWI